MNNFIFSNELKTELQFLLNNPTKLPSSLCFYGKPGNGKTTFAKHLSSKLTNDIRYYDCNGYKIEGTTSNSIVQSINKSCQTLSLNQFIEGDKPKPFDKVFIIDEFHNFSLQTQDSFKIAVEELSKRGILFIFILNTDSNIKSETYEKRVSPAMRSRFYSIQFDIKENQIDEVCEIVKKKHSHLPDNLIHQLVSNSDFRQLTMKSNMFN